MKLLRNFELHDILFDLESGKEFEKFNYPAPFDYLNDMEQDWGLFIQEIINNPLRRRNMISNLME